MWTYPPLENAMAEVVGGYLHLPPPEHSRTVYCNYEHYGPVSDGRVETVTAGIHAVFGSGRGGHGGGADNGSADGKNGREREDGRDSDRDGQLIRY